MSESAQYIAIVLILHFQRFLNDYSNRGRTIDCMHFFISFIILKGVGPPSGLHKVIIKIEYIYPKHPKSWVYGDDCGTPDPNRVTYTIVNN